MKTERLPWPASPDAHHNFVAASRSALADSQNRLNLRKATTTIRSKRAEVIAQTADWEVLRERAAALKRESLANLDQHLVELEEAVIRAGGVVHWAANASEANAIVVNLVSATGSSSVLKVKSLTTDEIELNRALLDAGITPIETDLAELIVQLDQDTSSHILVPAIHKNRSEIRTAFLNHMAGVDRSLSDDPRELAEAARNFLRERFLTAQVAISGANFACADTGTIAVVESEGNGRMCLTLPRTLITVMGIEKVIARFEDLALFLKILPASSTGERMNPYTSLWTGLTDGDGPQDFHLVLLDNGRRAILADSDTKDTLCCIRCSACLNVCPVYERVGGHAYGSVYPGPIGAILTPQLVTSKSAYALAYASTLCGACFDVCPVMIDIPDILVTLRGRATRSKHGYAPITEQKAMGLLGWILREQRRFEIAQRAALKLAQLFPRRSVPNFLGIFHPWAVSRDLPALPFRTFRQWWQSGRGDPNVATSLDRSRTDLP